MFTYYLVRKLLSEERLAAIARCVAIPMEPEVSHVGRSRRLGILCISGAVGYIATFAVISRVTSDPDALAAAAFGLITLSGCIGFLIEGYFSVPESSA